MTKHIAPFTMLALGVLLLAGGGCVAEEQVSNVTDPEPGVIVLPGSWVPDTRGPWDGAIYRATSKDGLTFTGKTLVLEQAGVPNLVTLENGDMILTYQYFSSESKDLFDAIAYSVSDDDGATWSDTQAVTFSGLPAPLDAEKHPMDPTLVQTDDGALRLYFTYHAKGKKNAALYSAIAADGDVTSPFVVETTPALTVSGVNLLDPSVVYFDGKWQHYSWQDSSDNNYHSVSDDGETFVREDDINLPMDFLGQVIPFGDGLRFYGTGKGGVMSAYSTDGATWKMDSGSRVTGADPSVQQLADGSYVMIFTASNFNE